MNDKKELRRKIYELDFALDELNLFLDSHPESTKAFSLLDGYRKLRIDTVKAYEEKYGEYIVTVNDAPSTTPWQWIKGPWPWENSFNEA